MQNKKKYPVWSISTETGKSSLSHPYFYEQQWLINGEALVSKASISTIQ